VAAGVCSNGYVQLLRRSRVRFLVGAAFVALAVYAAAAAASTSRARLAPITGNLSQSGYTVIALAYNGKAITAKGRDFSIAPPASPVTLQLVNAHGVYAGPVVVGGGGSRVYEGVRAGAKLGTITISNGYAVVARRLASRFIDKSRWAHAVHGVPVANGRNYGLVRIAGKHTGSSAPGGDLAHSGVPNDINIDPQANRQIAALAPASKHVKAKPARDGGGPGCEPGAICENFDVEAGLSEDVTGTANVDAAGSTIANIDAGLSRSLLLHIDSPSAYDEGNTAAAFPPGTSLAELNCAGLSWCSPGGSGDLAPTPNVSARGPAFPDCCDPSGDGFGTIFGPGAPTFTTGQPVFRLWPGATSAQIGTGDTLILDLTINGAVVAEPLTLAYVFDTVPAIDTWSDGAGHSGTITYPALNTNGGINVCAGASPGTYCNPIRVAANASGDVVLRLTWWRPQREGILGAGEPAFVDIGHLAYNFVFFIESNTPSTGLSSCPATAVTTSDPDLSFVQNQKVGTPELVDSADDQPANPANTLTATVDLTKCFTAANESFPVGTTISFGVNANPQQALNEGNAKTAISIERVG
jgi:hypothetical protein